MDDCPVTDVDPMMTIPDDTKPPTPKYCNVVTSGHVVFRLAFAYSCISIENQSKIIYTNGIVDIDHVSVRHPRKQYAF